LIFTKDNFKELTNNFIPVDCAIRGKDRIVFVFVDPDPDEDEAPKSRFIFFNLSKPVGDNFYMQGCTGYEFPRVAATPIRNMDTVILDMNGYVFSQEKIEDELPDDIDGSRPAPECVERIGEQLYAVGSVRRMYRRDGVNQWTDMTEELPLPEGYQEMGEEYVNFGWRDVSGFSESDIYAVGGLGDVWHFNGTDWRQCDFPSNELLYNVCCAADGQVYIGGNLGRLWVGKEDSWECASDQEFSMQWKDIVYFQKTLYLGSDYGLWTYSDGAIELADVPAQVQLGSGSGIDVNFEGDLMLVAGRNGASMFDGQTWEVLFDRAELL